MERAAGAEHVSTCIFSSPKEKVITVDVEVVVCDALVLTLLAPAEGAADS